VCPRDLVVGPARLVGEDAVDGAEGLQAAVAPVDGRGVGVGRVRCCQARPPRAVGGGDSPLFTAPRARAVAGREPQTLPQTQVQSRTSAAMAAGPVTGPRLPSLRRFRPAHREEPEREHLSPPRLTRAELPKTFAARDAPPACFRQGLGPRPLATRPRPSPRPQPTGARGPAPGGRVGLPLVGEFGDNTAFAARLNPC
jgi:hypothetical protein